MQRARALRSAETKSEKLLWSLLRAKQLSNLKFRRQYPVPPFFADFACIRQKLIIEIDGEYHDFIVEKDLKREQVLRDAGWDVLRFTDEDVVSDVEATGLAITRHIGIEYRVVKRSSRGSGMFAR